jgi:signal transduction histidine kinase
MIRSFTDIEYAILVMDKGILNFNGKIIPFSKRRNCMKQFSIKLPLKQVKRLLICTIGFILAILAINLSNWDSYWNKTIFQVQTVDFNILTHSLPSRLSQLLIKGERRELESVLDSNYGLFGLVLTDCPHPAGACPEQHIIHASQPEDTSLEPGWKTKLSQKKLENTPYDVLRDPPPVYSEWQYHSYSSRTRESTGLKNKGRTIGRIYYLRGIPPSFQQDTFQLLSNITKDANTGRYYLLTDIACILLCIFIFAFLINNDYRSEAESQKQRLQFELSEARRKEFERRWESITTFTKAFQEILNREFSSVLNNRLQELVGVLNRLDTDVKNICHDVYKAPLLCTLDVNVADKILNAAEDASKTQTKEREELVNRLRLHLQEGEQTVQTIDWVVKDLRQIATLEAHPLDICEEIRCLLENLPPNVESWKIVSDIPNEPIMILCNPWHLRSIVKNALYNSSSALTLQKMEHSFSDPSKHFEGRITVKCEQKNANALIHIQDNGPGFPDGVKERIYQVPERLDPDSSNGIGSMIVYAYLMLHGGSAHPDSTADGTLVTFEFPCQP